MTGEQKHKVEPNTNSISSELLPGNLNNNKQS